MRKLIKKYFGLNIFIILIILFLCRLHLLLNQLFSFYSIFYKQTGSVWY